MLEKLKTIKENYEPYMQKEKIYKSEFNMIDIDFSWRQDLRTWIFFYSNRYFQRAKILGIQRTTWTL